ncbi:winged helix DNA-binding domain-containing protein [Arthrobacter celericrescens]|uniref:winged helix DNA-binding domain-containing protein n=1 Tax=Arthrobacter celericrescens TaxID=2320851 RepID=UPI000EA0D528|nr:winged helix DNA-binding domain-containing protein [Arthrobacter celericrescens]
MVSAKSRVTAKTMGRLRLAGQGLLARAPGEPAGFASVEECVRHMTAMQAQDLASALWAVGQRVPGSTASDVRAALDSGTVVRSWPFRGTLHLVPPQDLRWMLEITGGRMVRTMAGRHRELGISSEDIAHCRDIAGELLASGDGATRERLFEAFEENGQITKAQRGVHLLGTLCLHAWLVQGPMAGSNGKAAGQQLFMPFGEWIPKSRELDRDEGITELLHRYLRSHGPATVDDFCWWTQIPKAEAKAALGRISGQLVELEFGGTSYWVPPETASLLDDGVPGARTLLALPGFDQFLLGYKDRSLVLAPEHAQKVVPGGNGVFKRMIVAGGSVVGTWARSGTGRNAAVVPEPFDADGLPPAAVRSFEVQAAKYLKFMAG